MADAGPDCGSGAVDGGLSRKLPRPDARRYRRARCAAGAGAARWRCAAQSLARQKPAGITTAACTGERTDGLVALPRADRARRTAQHCGADPAALRRLAR